MIVAIARKWNKELVIRISTLEKVGENMAKEFTILNLEHWIGGLNQAIFYHTSELTHHDQESEGAKTIQNELNKIIRSKEIAEFTIQLLREKEQCCGKCGGGFFEDGSVDGLCGGDECLPIKATDIRWCFVPQKGKEDEPLF